MMSRVVIVQPYVPSYRIEFFSKLIQRLAKENVECIVAAGMPSGTQVQRGDSTQPEWLVQIKQKGIFIGKKSLNLGITPAPWKHTDAVIMGLEGSSLPVYQALIAGQLTDVRVGLWGHIRPYIATGNPLDLWLEKRQMSVADHIFAYTPGGHAYALEAGNNADKITTVMNSLDTSGLESARDAITTGHVTSFASSIGIDPASTICFIGGLDESKRISFLADALDALWEFNANIKILVGGEGAEKFHLHAAFKRGQAIDLGYLNTSKKALVLSTSQCIAMPGRIGLVAVDALVMRLPIVTTNWPFHAPEAEYLVENQSRISTPDDPIVFARALDAYVKSPRKHQEFDYPRINDMVENFALGVLRMLSS